MKRIANIAFTFICLLMLLVPLSLTKMDGNGGFDFDRSGQFDWSDQKMEAYGSKAESWLKEKLGLHDVIINTYAVINDVFFGELINPVFQYGKDRFTFYRIHNNVGYNNFHKSFAESIANMQRYCESRGTKFYYIISPEKETVYKRYLPVGVNYNDEWVDKLVEELQELGVNCIDLRGLITELSYDEDVFNRKYDPGEWNQEGCYYGMRELTKRIHEDIPDVKVLEKNEYVVSDMITDTLDYSNQSVFDNTPQYKLKCGYQIVTEDAILAELKRSEAYPFFQVIQNESKEAAGIEHLLLFEDNIYPQFASARSRKTSVIFSLQNASNFEYYYTVFNPDVVVFESMERVLDEEHFSFENAEPLEYKPAVIKNYPKDDFSDRRRALFDASQSFNTNAEAVVIMGKAIDKVFISRKIGKGKYYYLITEDRAIDLKIDENGALTTEISHDEITIPGEVALYYLDDDGVGHYAMIPVSSKVSNIASQVDKTDGAYYDIGNGNWELTTDIENNSFNSSLIQLVDHEKDNEIINISNNNYSVGKVEGAYCHNSKTGNYTILIRGNTNLLDEYVEYRVRLKEGKTYWYSYIVDELSEEKIVFRDFTFSESR